MDLDDDVDYELMQQYEDELYGGQESQGSDSGGIDSDVEDAMLSRLYYTSNTKGAKATNNSKETTQSKRDSPPPATAQHSKKRAYDQLSSSDLDSENDEIKVYGETAGSGDEHIYADESRQASCEADSDEDDDSDDNSIVFTPAKAVEDNDIPVTKIIDLEQPMEMDNDVKDTDEYAYMDSAAFQDRNRYFQNEEGRQQQNSRNACYLCGQLGHQQKDCPKCRQCGSMEHRTRYCLANVQCFKCKKMGHRSADCKNQSSKECFRCSSILHNSEDCPSIWRIYKLTAKKNPRDVWCCHCAAQGHSYLDCNVKDAFAKKAIMARDSIRHDHMSHRREHDNSHYRRDRGRSPPAKIQRQSYRGDTSDRRSRYDDHHGRSRRDEPVSHNRSNNYHKHESHKHESHRKSYNQPKPQTNHTPTNRNHRNGNDYRRSDPQPTRSGTLQLSNNEGRGRHGNNYSNDFPRNAPKLPQPTSSGIIGLPPGNRGSPRYRGGYRAAV
ncbi:hypothetical protein BC943DRAFT_380885 [Umbelopsis sp. AD052]|nr:hypothetical protein BC943DRAFT_380885 [Umbelopsis sp. AD052]